MLMIIIMFWGVFLCLFSGFFIRPFYKMMLGKQISLKDMESVVRFLLHYRTSDFGSVKYLFLELALLK